MFRRQCCRRNMLLRARKPHDMVVRVSKVTVHTEPDAGQCDGCDSIRRVELDVAVESARKPRRAATER
jgi:hypothetical protein